MTFNLKNVSRKSFIYKLTIWGEHKFTGRLTVRTLSGVEWTLYLCIGRLIWVTGGNHVARQLYRHLYRDKLKLDLDTLLRDPNFQSENSNLEYGWDYHAIYMLMEKKKISVDRAKDIVEQIIVENLFDIMQHEFRELLIYEEFGSDLDRSTINFIKIFNIKPLLLNAIENWKMWQKLKLNSIFLDSAPILKNEAKIQEKTSPKTYQHMVKLMNGKRTLRDVASLINKNEIKVVKSLIPFVETGMIQLVELPDFSHPGPKARTSHHSISDRAKKRIICVDDSLQIHNLMRGIIQDAGYEFIGLRDPVRALGVLIDRQPDLIFLDLVMPVINGYELCRQIRRVASLKNVPIVILTSGRIDAWRSKMAGASDCTKKPIDPQKILSTIEKYLSPKNAVRAMEKSPAATRSIDTIAV